MFCFSQLHNMKVAVITCHSAVSMQDILLGFKKFVHSGTEIHQTEFCAE